MIKHQMILNLTCSDSAACSDAIIAKLESQYAGNKFKSRVLGDDVTGSTVIQHTPGAHDVTIYIYDGTENKSEFFANPKNFIGTKPTTNDIKSIDFTK